MRKKSGKPEPTPDPLPETEAGLEGRPEAANLVGIFAALSGQTPAEVLADYAGQNFSVFKPALAELTVEKIGPITARMTAYLDDTAHLDAILNDGAERAQALAEPVLAEVKKIVGFA